MSMYMYISMTQHIHVGITFYVKILKYHYVSKSLYLQVCLTVQKME